METDDVVKKAKELLAEADEVLTDDEFTRRAQEEVQEQRILGCGRAGTNGLPTLPPKLSRILDEDRGKNLMNKLAAGTAQMIAVWRSASVLCGDDVGAIANAERSVARAAMEDLILSLGHAFDHGHVEALLTVPAVKALAHVDLRRPYVAYAFIELTAGTFSEVTEVNQKKLRAVLSLGPRVWIGEHSPPNF